MSARYVIEERVSPAGSWEPANLPVSPWHDDLRDAIGVLRALQSPRFRVRDTRPDLAVAEGLERTRRDDRQRAEIIAVLAANEPRPRRKVRARTRDAIRRATGVSQ